jgi:hypothetical protein
MLPQCLRESQSLLILTAMFHLSPLSLHPVDFTMQECSPVLARASAGYGTNLLDAAGTLVRACLRGVGQPATR